jgi:endonuclease/exonuclease/phosphatase (EEP) superfamily protein YafD
VLGCLVFTAFLRLTHTDNWVGGVFVSAVAPISFLAAYPVLAVASWRRRRAATVVAAICVALQVTWFHAMLPIVHRARPLPSGASRVRVMTANLQYQNPSAEQLGRIIQGEHPDLLALEEFSDRTAPEVERSGALTAFPYRAVRVTDGSDGIALYSRLPLRDVSYTNYSGRLFIRAGVLTASGPITVFVVHTTSPVDAQRRTSWSRELSLIRAMAAAERGPLLVVGDFNATDGNRPFVNLLHRDHLADVLDATGSGYATTWPQDHHLLPALVRPDHVLVGHGIAALSGRTVDNPGSDHRAVVVDIGVRAS